MADKKIQVVALSTGFYGYLREPGDRFEVTVHDDDENEGRAKWYREVDKKGDAVLTKEEKKDPQSVPVIPADPSAPSNGPYKIKHAPVGNYVVVDNDGVQVGEQFKKVSGDPGASKIAAQQEADRMNQGGQVAGVPLSPQQAAVVTQTALSVDPALNDPKQIGDTDEDDGHPDA